MQIDVVRHFARRMIGQVEFNRVTLANSNEAARVAASRIATVAKPIAFVITLVIIISLPDCAFARLGAGTTQGTDVSSPATKNYSVL